MAREATPDGCPSPADGTISESTHFRGPHTWIHTSEGWVSYSYLGARGKETKSIGFKRYLNVVKPRLEPIECRSETPVQQTEQVAGVAPLAGAAGRSAAKARHQECLDPHNGTMPYPSKDSPWVVPEILAEELFEDVKYLLTIATERRKLLPEDEDDTDDSDASFYVSGELFGLLRIAVIMIGAALEAMANQELLEQSSTRSMVGIDWRRSGRCCTRRLASSERRAIDHGSPCPNSRRCEQAGSPCAD